MPSILRPCDRLAMHSRRRCALTGSSSNGRSSGCFVPPVQEGARLPAARATSVNSRSSDPNLLSADLAHMTLPERINSDAELEAILAEPSDADLEWISRLRGDILILGASGKMGPSLARRVHRAVQRTGRASRVMAASRFSSPDVYARLNADGIRT